MRHVGEELMTDAEIILLAYAAGIGGYFFSLGWDYAHKNGASVPTAITPQDLLRAALWPVYACTLLGRFTFKIIGTP